MRGTDSRGKVFANGFMHGCLLQEWWLKNLKLNYSSGYRRTSLLIARYRTMPEISDPNAYTGIDKSGKTTILGIDTFPYSKATPLIH